MRFVALLVLALIAGCTGCVSLPAPGKGAVSLKMGEGSCSGTAVGRYTILTAAHCLKDEAGVIGVDGVDVGYAVLAQDGNDHALVRVSKRQVRYSRIAKMPRPGSPVVLLGNPQGLQDLWRRGIYSGELEVPGCPAFSTRAPCKLLLLDMNSTEGDSGAGVFDERGMLVGVITGGLKYRERSGHLWGMTVTLPLAFTKEQWEQVR